MRAPSAPLRVWATETVNRGCSTVRPAFRRLGMPSDFGIALEVGANIESAGKRTDVVMSRNLS